MAALLVAAAAASSGCSYNRFVSQEEAVKAQWAQVENQLQRRNDLIPNLVETTKGFAQQERDVFQAIADSRAKLAGAQTPEQKIAGGQRAVVGARPPAGHRRELSAPQVERDLRALMDELAGTENRIAVERMRYNERVQAVQHLAPLSSRPTSPRASSASDEYPLFQAPEAAKVAPKVDFGRPPASP